MSTHVITEMKTKQGLADELVAVLSKALPDSLRHAGCEAIDLRRDQDDRNHIVSFTRWATRKHYEEYLQWRTEAGMTDHVESMLVEPLRIQYFDEVVSLAR